PGRRLSISGGPVKLNRQRLVWQLYPSYLLMILLVLLAVIWYISGELRSFHYRQTAADLSARVRLVEPQLVGLFDDNGSERLKELTRKLGEESATRITVIRTDGKVLADSKEDAALMDNHRKRPEVKQALMGRQGMSVRFSNTLGQSLMYIAVPIMHNGRLVGSIRTALPVSDIDATLGEIQRQLLLGGLLIALLMAPICWWLSRRLSRPLELMTAGAQRFSRGELETPLQITGSQETGRLATAMNQMAVELAQRIEREVEQRGEIEAILGCMIEGIVAVDRNECVIRLNNASTELFGISPLTSPGRPIQEVIRQAELQRFIRQALSQQKPLAAELVMFGPKNSYLHVQATPLTGQAGEWVGALIVLHDLTRLRQLESVRRDFVANVSHELKTPITAIRSAVEILLDSDPADSDGQRFMQIIFKQNNRLNALVEDLLDLSRIEQGSNQGGWDLITEPLFPVLESARAACEPLIQQQQIELELSISKALEAAINAPLLEQAIINLLTNAIKYSAVGGKVVLATLETATHVQIQVQDFGCGIEKKHLSRLFERFYRVDAARSRNLGGTGLGLAIVKHAIHAHKGEVKVTSVLGQGSTFSILLPKSTG
ncbi:MAG: ATP-binding protein, partial [Geopsychrobacter sp.]|nr:ATP-binding protein [Geopsychrobacter sp.]